MWPRQDHTSPSPKIHGFTATFFSGTKRMSIIPSIPIYVTYLKPLAPHILHSVVNLYTDLYLNFSDPIFHPSPHLKLFHFWVPLKLVISKISFLNVFFMHSFTYFLWDPSLPLGPCFSCSPPEQWLFFFQSLRITGPESGVGFLFLYFIDAVQTFSLLHLFKNTIFDSCSVGLWRLLSIPIVFPNSQFTFPWSLNILGPGSPLILLLPLFLGTLRSSRMIHLTPGLSVPWSPLLHWHCPPLFSFSLLDSF